MMQAPADWIVRSQGGWMHEIALARVLCRWRAVAKELRDRSGSFAGAA